MVTAIVAIIVFGILVFIHELGHFTVAKLVGIKVHEFALGMGPKLIYTTKGDTLYSIRLLPLGGYVKMEGEDEKSEDERSFNKKPVLARIAVIFAGPFMNFILAIVLFLTFFYFVGSPTTIISKVQDQSPAQVAGIEAGDSIYAINGQKIHTWEEVTERISKSEGSPMEITIIRDGEHLEKTVIPMQDETSNRILIGITTTMKKSLSSAGENALFAIKSIVRGILEFLRNLVGRKVNTGEVMGPVGIINLVGEVSKTGLLDIVSLTAVLSVNLGLMNLLPIPALDGSRILFLIIEMLRGKPVDQDKEGMIHLIGFGILMTFMVFITFQDIQKLFG